MLDRQVWTHGLTAAAAWIVLAAGLFTPVSAVPVHEHGGHSHGAALDHHDPAVVGGPQALSDITEEYLSSTTPFAGPTRGKACDAGSRPEKVQGKVPKADYESG